MGWKIPQEDLTDTIIANSPHSFWLPILGVRSGKLDVGLGLGLVSIDAVFCTYSLFDRLGGKRSGMSMAEAYVGATVAGRSLAAHNGELTAAVRERSDKLFPSFLYSLGSPLFKALISGEAGSGVSTSFAERDTHRLFERGESSQVAVAALLLAFVVEIEDWPMYSPSTGEVVSLDLGCLMSVLPYIIARRVPGESVAPEYSKELHIDGEVAALLMRWSRREIDLVDPDPEFRYPAWASTSGSRALVVFFESDMDLALEVDRFVRHVKPDAWVGNPTKERALRDYLEALSPLYFHRIDDLLELLRAHHEYH